MAGQGSVLVPNSVVMSSTNEIQTTNLQARYDLVHEVYDAYTDLNEEVKEGISHQTFSDEKTPSEWRDTLEQILLFKNFARQIQGKDFLKKPRSGSDMLFSYFGRSAALIGIVWFIAEQVFPLSWDLWLYILIITGAAGAYTGLMSQLKKETLKLANARLAEYKQHEPMLKVARRAESRIEPIYNDFLHPLLAFLYEEVPPQNILKLHFDIRHWKLNQYKTNGVDPGASRYVTSTEFFNLPLFAVTGKLADGASLYLSVDKLVRIRNIRKTNPRGKVKYKTKYKYKLIYQLQIGFPSEAYTPSGKVGNVATQIKIKQSTNERRHTIKLQQAEASANNILPKHHILIELMSLAYSKVRPKQS